MQDCFTFIKWFDHLMWLNFSFKNLCLFRINILIVKVMIKSLHCCFCKKTQLMIKNLHCCFCKKNQLMIRNLHCCFCKKTQLMIKNLHCYLCTKTLIYTKTLHLSLIIGVLENICERGGEGGLCKWNQGEITEIS